MRGRKNNEERERKKTKTQIESIEEESIQGGSIQEEGHTEREQTAAQGGRVQSVLGGMLAVFARALSLPLYNRSRERRETTERINEEASREAERSSTQESVQTSMQEDSNSTVAVSTQRHDAPEIIIDILTDDMEQTQEEANQIMEQNIREIQRTLLSTFDSFYNRLGRNRGEQTQEQNRYEQEASPELGVQFVNFVRRIDNPNNIVFTIIYYTVADDAQRNKAVSLDELQKSISEEEAKENEGKCSICLEDIKEKETVRRLTCKHYFHSECVTAWLTKYVNECPMCRAKAVDVAETDKEEA